MTLHLMRRKHLLIPLVFSALAGCHDSIPTSTTGPLDIPGPRFSTFPGNNGRIAFAGHGGVSTMNPDGSDVQVVTTDGAGPVWSRDGTRLAFYSRINTPNDGTDNIYVINADGTGRTQLTFMSSPPGASFPSWSPDGSRIVFQDNLRIYVMDSDGSDVTLLTASGFGPSWSPDGTRIAFTTTRDGTGNEIYVMNADGSNQIRLTTNAQSDYDPNWSPDGSRLAFTRDGANPGETSDIYAMDPDGSDVTNLTQSSAAFEFSAAWSPDGTQIAFSSSTNDSPSEIFVMNVNGSGLANISNTPLLSEVHLDWQPQPTIAVCIFGPTVYTREKGPPGRFTEQITATPGSYIVDLDDLGSSGADAIVKLNGVVIMDGRGTTGEVGPRHHMVPVTLAASNVLEIDIRGKKGSVLQVKICPEEVACYPGLPDPQLVLESTAVNDGFVRFELNVPNHAQFPDALFAPAPNLAACGLNTSASRTWVDIYDGNGNIRYGFCSLGAAADMNGIFFAEPVEQWPEQAYIVIHDRQCNITYTSNRISLAEFL